MWNEVLKQLYIPMASGLDIQMFSDFFLFVVVWMIGYYFKFSIMIIFSMHCYGGNINIYSIHAFATFHISRKSSSQHRTYIDIT